MKKILFIIPPYFNFKNIGNDSLDSIPVFTTPYGILSLIAYVKKHATNEVDFAILDLNLEAYKLTQCNNCNIDLENELYSKVHDEITKNNFDIVGISALFNNAYSYLDRLTSIIKKQIKPPLCIVGGGLASNLYYELLTKFTNIDAICLAEGEIPILDLVESENPINTVSEHKSWITKNKIEKNFKFEPSYVFNLDEIPPLEYDLIELDYYNSRSVDKKFSKKDLKREFSIHTSRGCPYNCVYCSNTSIHGKKVRIMSLERIMKEVDYLIANMGMNVLLIEDDHFLADTNRAIKVLEELSKRNLRIEFPNGISVKGITEELGVALKKAGVSAVNLAVESGSNFVLKKLIKKAHLNKHIEPAVNILRKNDIKVHAFIVLGIPGEMPEHREETKNMLKEVGFDWVYIFLAVPIAGSRLYDICEQNDYLVEKDFSKHLISTATIKAPGVDPETIQKEMYLMNLEVNFIENWNVRNKRFNIALPYFENMIEKYKSHAFSYLVLYRIHKALDTNKEVLDKLKIQYYNLINKNKDWEYYSQYFNVSNIDE